MSDLLELAARVEAATGADRELDARIWCAVSPAPESYTADSWMRGDPRPAGCDVVGVTLSGWLDKWPDEAAKMADSYGVPKFTTSVDAAISLVPEGLELAIYTNWALTKGFPEEDGGGWIITAAMPRGCWVRTYGLSESGFNKNIEGQAFSIACAIVALALRSRAGAEEA